MNDHTTPVHHSPDTDALRAEIITNQDRHQFLGAGAGAGKTTVLVEHYFHLLGEGVKPSALIAVTFTDKAAAEMKARLREECRQKAREQSDAASDARETVDWERLLHEIEAAPISTIHSLCARLLRENALAAGLDPDFAVLDEIDSRILLDDVVRRTLLARLGTQDTADTLAVALGYDAAVAHITTLVEDRAQLEGVLADPCYENPEALERHWELERSQGQESLLARIGGHEQLIAGMRRLAQTRGPEGDGLETRRQVLCGIIAEYGLESCGDEGLTPEQGDRIIEGLRAMRQVNAGRAGRADAWQKLGLDKDEMVATQNQFIHNDGALAEYDEDLKALAREPESDRACAELTCALLTEVKAAVEAYAQAREQLSALDFEDLMERTRTLWREHPEALERTRRSLRHVMIDEFQDTNILQKQVLWPLVTGQPYDPGQPVALPAEGVRLFVVGDAKQSIYRFRNADVAVFNATRREMRGGAARDDELTRNFRSTRSLIEVFNELFGHPDVMGPEADELWKASYAQMQAVREDPDPEQAPLEVHLLAEQRSGAEAGEGEDTDLKSLRMREARWLAARLVHLIQSGQARVGEGKGAAATWRPVRPRDVAILFRGMTDVHLYERALREAGLPYYLVVGRGFYGAQEVQDIINVLRAIENSLDDIALVGALRSPMFGLSDETLYRLGQLGSGPWWDRLGKAARDLDSEAIPGPAALIAPGQQPLVTRAARLLAALQASKNRLSLSELVQGIIDRTGYAAVLAGQFGGRQPVSNVRKLVQLAGEFEAGQQSQGQGSLRDFVERLKRMTADEIRENQAPVEEEAGDCVKLITYHSAKGLQWPVVVAPDLCRKRGGGFGPPYRFHRDMGLVAKTTRLMKQGNQDSYWPALGRQIHGRNSDEEDAENRRLFYVAATRARDLLILSSSVALKKDGGPPADALAGPLGWINKALPGSLWAAQGNAPGQTLLRWQQGSLISAPDLATSDETYRGVDRQAETRPEVSLETLGRRVAAIPPDTAGQSRFTATELSRYCHCPRLYQLQTHLGLPATAPSFGSASSATRLSPMELGTVIHRVLQLVGTGGQAELDRLVPQDTQMLRMDTRLDKRAAQESETVRRQVRRFLEHDLYAELFATDSRLRSEVGLTVLLDVEGQQVVVEGKIDALIQTADGRLHLLDYKTGREDPAGDRQYRVQLGLYCYAVQQATGALPATARLVYLSDAGLHTPDPSDVEALMRDALESARQAVAGIRHGCFEARAGHCEHCPGWTLCREGRQASRSAAAGA